MVEQSWQAKGCDHYEHSAVEELLHYTQNGGEPGAAGSSIQDPIFHILWEDPRSWTVKFSAFLRRRFFVRNAGRDRCSRFFDEIRDLRSVKAPQSRW